MIDDEDEFEAYVTSQILGPMAESHVSLTLWNGGVDWKLAIEVGAAVLMDKPVILIVGPDAKVPENLVRMGARIIEGPDWDDHVSVAVFKGLLLSILEDVK